jgi:dienelactone hydrolase
MVGAGLGGPRRWLALALGLVLALALPLALATGCSAGGGSNTGSRGSAGTEDGATTADAAESGATPSASAEPPFAVGRRTMDMVDHRRSTEAYPPASVAAAPDRTIAVTLFYPAEGDPPAEDETVGSSRVDAPPADGPFPLVVFAHGFNGRGDAFVPYGEMWARAGYVVALPTFPLTRQGVGDAADYQNQPGDVSFVIDQVLGFRGGDPLAGIADPDHIAVGGHSLGAVTVFGAAYNTCCRDDRIDAVISVSGGGLQFDGGEYVERGTAPLLLIQGERDQLVRVGVGDATFRNRPGPITYLRLARSDHSSMFWGDDAPLLETAILAFLDDRLRGDPSGMRALPGEVRSAAGAVLRTK